MSQEPTAGSGPRHIRTVAGLVAACDLLSAGWIALWAWALRPGGWQVIGSGGTSPLTEVLPRSSWVWLYLAPGALGLFALGLAGLGLAILVRPAWGRALASGVCVAGLSGAGALWLGPTAAFGGLTPSAVTSEPAAFCLVVGALHGLAALWTRRAREPA